MARGSATLSSPLGEDKVEQRKLLAAAYALEVEVPERAGMASAKEIRYGRGLPRLK
jgi:hypothetical protein